MDDSLLDKHLFLMAEGLSPRAVAELPAGFHFRNCREDELEIWKAMPFDTPAEARQYRGFMTAFFDRVYGDRREEFFSKCLFACDGDDRPVGTVFLWKIYGELLTVHWWKVLKTHEGRGIGRALLFHVMKPLGATDYPVFLHTQLGSLRAVRLYCEMGFRLLTDPVIGSRRNELEECRPTLCRALGEVPTARAPARLLEVLKAETEPQF